MFSPHFLRHPMHNPGRFWHWALTLMALMVLAGCSSANTTSPEIVTPTLAQELTFYDWAQDVPLELLAAFTEETGVKVNYVTYESQEEALANIKAGQNYDVVIMENRMVQSMIADNLLATIDYDHVPNFKNISLNFRDLTYDPRNQHSIPYSWGTTGIIVRTDLIGEVPVTRWSDMWQERFRGKIATWGIPRYIVGMALKSLDYSANSTSVVELTAAKARLLELLPNIAVIVNDTEELAAFLDAGDVSVVWGAVTDMVLISAHYPDLPLDYVLPEDGTILWGDNYVIPANSPNKTTAEVFLNFMLEAENSATVVNATLYSTPNEAARPFIDPALLDNPLVVPPLDVLKNAELLLALSPEDEARYDSIWQEVERALAQSKTP